MSGDGPESIPTSADPKSHRPTKRRALTPSSAHAASLDALFAKPDQHVHIPLSATAVSSFRTRAPPPEIVTNVQGSSAGAGSGEFHVYKASRRREYERLKEMDELVKSEKGQQEFETAKSERERKDEERTRRNREKREKMKARKKNNKQPQPGGNTSQEGGQAGDVEKGEGAGFKPTSTNGTGQESRNGKDLEHVGRNGQDGGSATTVLPAQTPGLIIHDDED